MKVSIELDTEQMKKIIEEILKDEMEDPNITYAEALENTRQRLKGTPLPFKKEVVDDDSSK